MNLLRKFRYWFDGWEHQPDKSAVTVQSSAQEFAVRLAQELDRCLHREILVLPDGPALVPASWLIFFNSSDDKAWRGIKRQALQQWLTRVLLERVKALLPLQEPSLHLHLEIRLDPTLRPGEFKILPLWDFPFPSEAAAALPELGRQV